MSELLHLSYSSINLYLTCPENFRRKYLIGESTPSTPALLTGSAFHNTIERYIATKETIEAIPDDLTLSNLWHTAWGEQIEKNTDVDWGADTPEEHYNEGIRILSTAEVQDLADSLTPASDESGLWIERKMELWVPGVPIPIVGYIDIVTDDGVPGDFKTSKYQWSTDKAESEMQPLFYLASLNQAGVEVPGLRFRHYIVTKAKQPKVQVIEHSHTYAEIFWLFGLVQQVWQAIEREAFPPNPNGWLCGPKYCGFWTSCRGAT
jgi:hypothetical protein